MHSRKSCVLEVQRSSMNLEESKPIVPYTNIFVKHSSYHSFDHSIEYTSIQQIPETYENTRLPFPSSSHTSWKLKGSGRLLDNSFTETRISPFEKPETWRRGTSRRGLLSLQRSPKLDRRRADFQERRLVGGRTVLDVDAAAAASTAVDARRRDEIAPPPGGTRCRADELSREKYANPIGPDPRGPSSAARKAVYRNEYFSIPRPRLDSRTRRFRARFRTRPASVIRSR